MKAMLVQDPVSVARARARLQMLNALAVHGGRVEMTLGSAEVAARTRFGFPTATGESRGGVHILEARLTGKVFETGVGIRSTPNAQEIKIEAGLMRPHTSLDEHDPGGKKCSSGVADWGDETEPVNVRAERGRLEANPNARTRPLARAIVELHGDIVDLEAGTGFRAGRVNAYRPSGLRLGHSKLREAIMRAVQRMIHLGMLAVVVFVVGHNALCPYTAQAQPPSATWDKSNWRGPFAARDTLAAGEWMHSRVLNTTDRWGSPQFFALYLSVKGFGASHGNPALKIYTSSGRDSARADFATSTAAGDTTWCEMDTLGRKAIPLPAVGGDWLVVHLLNAAGGDTVIVAADSTSLWMKH